METSQDLEYKRIVNEIQNKIRSSAPIMLTARYPSGYKVDELITNILECGDENIDTGIISDVLYRQDYIDPNHYFKVIEDSLDKTNPDYQVIHIMTLEVLYIASLACGIAADVKKANPNDYYIGREDDLLQAIFKTLIKEFWGLGIFDRYDILQQSHRNWDYVESFKCPMNNKLYAIVCSGIIRVRNCTHRLFTRPFQEKLDAGEFKTDSVTIQVPGGEVTITEGQNVCTGPSKKLNWQTNIILFEDYEKIIDSISNIDNWLNVFFSETKPSL